MKKKNKNIVIKVIVPSESNDTVESVLEFDLDTIRKRKDIQIPFLLKEIGLGSIDIKININM